MSVKIAIGGPPHSGKTVLMGVLRGLLPRDKFNIVEATPDGEGITGWSFEADAELVKAVRRKGKFSHKLVDWVVDAVRASSAPVTLVDLGGMLLDSDGNFDPRGVRMTLENERIVRECDYLIVIANPSYAEAAQTWVEEGVRLGAQPLAILESVLEGADDEIFDTGFPLRARITKLEREDPPVDSLTAKAVAQRILELAGETSTDGSEQADVNFPALAEEHGWEEWPPAVLPKLVRVVSERVSDQPVRLWGNTPLGAPYHALACGFKQVEYYDPKIPWGYVMLPNLLTQDRGGQLLDWRVEERDGHSLVEFSIPGQIFDVEDLPKVSPPAATLNKGVVISGKAPRWLTGALARAYTRAGARWVAVFEPRESGRSVNGRSWGEVHPGKGPAVVVYSRDSKFPVGSVVPFRI